MRRRRVTRYDRRVLDAVASISDAALDRWIAKGYFTVMPLARCELARRRAERARKRAP